MGCGNGDLANPNSPLSNLNFVNNGSNSNNGNTSNNGGNQSPFDFLFSGSSNAITSQFPANTVVTGSLTPAAVGATGLQSQLTQALTSPSVGTRSLNISISDINALAVNDQFPVGASNLPAPRATINYTEQTTAGTLAFSSQAGGGTLVIVSISPGAGVSGTIDVELIGVNLDPVNQAGNSATGILGINGTETLTL